MSMEYRTLARLFHADRSGDSYANHDRLAKQRLNDDSTFATGIGTPLGELFIATPRCMCILLYLVVFRFGLTECLEIEKRWYFNAFAIL